jgi:hypothetical protein
MHRHYSRLARILKKLFGLLLAIGLILAHVRPAGAEGSRDLYPNGLPGSRANLEWRTSSYGPTGPPDSSLPRRTLLKVFANAGEFILVGSSAVGVASGGTTGDILIYNPGTVTGVIGKEVIPGSASYSCLAQASGVGGLPNQGRILSRAQEVAGPDTIPSTTAGYVPCYYQAPMTGIYNVVIHGPSGANSNDQGTPTGDITLAGANNFNASQSTSVAAWDVTVRSALNSPTDFTGRLFSFYLTLFTGGNGLPVNSTIYAITTDGYRYRTEMRAMDPNGFLVYGNQIGFYDSDRQTPLYHDVLSTVGATNPNQLTQLQGGVDLAPPEYPIFFNLPDPAALTAIGIPLTPTAPTMNVFNFLGTVGGNTSLIGTGGSFTYTSNIGGVYEIIISRDGVDFEPTNPLNRVLRGVRGPGANTIAWDGDDNSGNPFPVGNNYAVRASIHAGEYHFPLFDAENSINGGPTYTLLNPPGGTCPFVLGCSTAFNDDRGYQTLNGSVVGTVGSVLCGASPPVVPYSGINGFDSNANPNQRRYGAATGGNAGSPCNGSFGDTKGLDLWTYFPSNVVLTTLNIVATAPPTNTPTDTPTATNPAGPTNTPAPSDTPGPINPTPGPGPTSELQTPVPAIVPGTGIGPGPNEFLITLILALLAALTPFVGWRVLRRRRG